MLDVLSHFLSVDVFMVTSAHKDANVYCKHNIQREQKIYFHLVVTSTDLLRHFHLKILAERILEFSTANVLKYEL